MASLLDLAEPIPHTLSEREATQVHARLREGFAQGVFRSVKSRRRALSKLRTAIKQYEDELFDALKADLRKPAFEAYTSEIGFCYQEIDHTLAHLDEWTAVRDVDVSVALWPTRASSRYLPKGVVLIISPWNYPLNLALAPLVAAIAAGNTVALKPAEDTPNTSVVIGRIIAEAFEPTEVLVVQGPGGDVVPTLMDAGRFDHVFYTGSTRIGRHLGKVCGEALIPCTLELGGKSPAIVLRDAKLQVAVDRLVWGKLLNAGQTCVAPDYVLVEQPVYDEFLRKLKDTILKAYGEEPASSPDLARIVNEKHTERLIALINDSHVYHGGQYDLADRFIAPTVLTEVELDDAAMQEEIFGPVLPVLPIDSWEAARTIIARHPNPLASYLFTEDSDNVERWIDEVQFGGGCVNDTVIHLGIPGLPFGGVQQSGIGRYHADEGFKTFSNQKSVATTSTLLNVPTRFAPYTQKYLKAVKWLLG